MLRVTKLADYGIVLMARLAGQEGRIYNARDLAAEVRLPLPMVSKILKLLARDGLLESHRGIKGGYGLARPPAGISIARVIRALEGPIAVTECTDGIRGECGLEKGCPVRANWHLINQAIYRALDQITLAEMIRPLTKSLMSVAELANRDLVQLQ